MQLPLSIMPGTYAVCRLNPQDATGQWTGSRGFVSVTRTGDELSVVCLQDDAPAGAAVERGYRLLKIEGPLSFSLTGVLASLVSPLADEQISVLAISTYETDYLLVRSDELTHTVDTLTRAGHRIADAS
jgi:hypothetical protein